MPYLLLAVTWSQSVSLSSAGGDGGTPVSEECLRGERESGEGVAILGA